MAAETRRAVVRISIDPVMMIIHIILIIVFMTVDACELAVIVRVVVAIGAGVPFPIVPSAVDREVLIIVIES